MLSKPQILHTLMGRQIIKYCIYYYYPEKIHSDWVSDLQISDEKFDDLCTEYLELCYKHDFCNEVWHDNAKMDLEKFKKIKTIVNGEVDFSRPTVQLLLSQYSKSKKDYKNFLKELEIKNSNVY